MLLMLGLYQIKKQQTGPRVRTPLGIGITVLFFVSRLHVTFQALRVN